MSESRLSFTLYSKESGRAKWIEAWFWVLTALEGEQKLIVTITKATRSTEQNNLMWSILGDISRQLDWPIDGQMMKGSPEDWKDILSAGLKSHSRVAKGCNGGFVVLGQRTSKMTIKEMSDLIELAYAFGADHGIKWSRTSLGREISDEVFE